MDEHANNNITTAQTEEPLPEESKRQEEAPDKKTSRAGGMSFMDIVGGDILNHDFFRRQIPLLLLIVLYAIIYISNRYDCQQKMIEIDRLKKELTDIRYDALTRSSELTEKSRQSKIEEYFPEGEARLQTSANPPYLIK